MARMPLTIENRRIKPFEIGAVANTPNNTTDTGIGEIKPCRLLLHSPDRLILACWLLGRDALRRYPGIDPRVDVVVGVIRFLKIGSEIRCKDQLTVIVIHHAAVQRHAFVGEMTQIDIPPAITARDVMIGVASDIAAQGMRIDRHAVVTHLIEPTHHILAPIEACDTWGVTCGQMYLASGQVQILRDLRARLPRANHQHRAARQLPCVLILCRMQLPDLTRQALRHARDHRLMVTPGTDDHLTCLISTIARLNRVTPVGILHNLPDFHALFYRRCHLIGKTLQPCHGLASGHKAIRIIAIVS